MLRGLLIKWEMSGTCKLSVRTGKVQETPMYICTVKDMNNHICLRDTVKRIAFRGLYVSACPHFSLTRNYNFIYSYLCEIVWHNFENDIVDISRGTKKKKKKKRG
ncbi:hypothetical protein POVWA2_028220 [Plasmodium ovale wallikeri]|uniref:Uncharacterized protein n=1 Tax=Plasmodium ovale wallikeri TaxID=864142 RepID=A0A1A8YWJ0_PLAOA|nr:hypothetical protein POVWA1_028370 [Plasmodium ovale wallikeri]SBT36066.1 hypothetical protein POVWA2_028220 [Plasmodium ovale wallikeri]